MIKKPMRFSHRFGSVVLSFGGELDGQDHQSILAFCVDFSAVVPDDSLGDGQAEAVAAA